MATKRISEKQIITFFAIKISKYEVAVDASINFEVRDPRRCRDDTSVYKFETRLEIEGQCTYPETRVGEKYQVGLYGSPLHDGDFTLRLADCLKRNEHGEIIERKVRGQHHPVYDPPSCIGMIDRQRAPNRWTGWAWVSPQTVTDMLILLPQVHPLYLEIQEIKIGRNYRIGGLILKTRDPSEE